VAARPRHRQADLAVADLAIGESGMGYAYVPLPKRKPLRWPNGARLAVIVTSNLEFWEQSRDTDKPAYPGGPAVVTNIMTGRYYDNPNWTWREYGQRVGIWRMFDEFERADVPTSCTLNARLALERREIVEHAVSRGWEILAHNYVQTEPLADYQFDVEGERTIIRETLKVYREVVGKPAKGWLSTSLRCTPNTADLVAEEGLDFFTDYLNDDQPYLIDTKSGKQLVSIPYTAELNDFQMFMHQGRNVDEALAVYREAFDELYREGATSGRLFNLGLHPHVTGQPHRIRSLRDFLQYAKRFPDVWWTTREEIAEWYRKNHHNHIG
jgi:allantoinase